MRCGILTGLKGIFKAECHDYPKIKHLYTDYDNEYPLYGRGFSYSRILDPSLRNPLYDESIVNDIKRHRYDIVIYGSYHRGEPFLDLVKTFYRPTEVIFICGEDVHNCNYQTILEKNPFYNVFVREFE